jgi:hypothetical protein
MLLAALLGVSLGVIVGRLAWTAYARDLYVVPEAVTPWWWIAIVVGATVIAANLVAIVPAWRAARRPPVGGSARRVMVLAPADLHRTGVRGTSRGRGGRRRCRATPRR